MSLTPKEKYQMLKKEGVPDFHNNELLKACKEDKELLAEVLLNNKNIILSIISRHRYNIKALEKMCNVDEEDILQHAYIGIMYALENFDFDKGVKFTTYMYRPVIWEINQCLFNNSKMIRLTRNAVELLKQIEDIVDELGYFPSADTIASMLDIPVKKVEEILRFVSDITYFDAYSDLDPEDKDAEFEAEVMDSLYIENALKNAGLDEKEMKIINLLRKGYNKSQIAEELGMYPMSVSRTIDRIKAKIENTYIDKGISKYEDEINLVMNEIEERGEVLEVSEIKELLDVCGFDIDKYTKRTLHYIREMAVKRLSNKNKGCKKESNRGE